MEDRDARGMSTSKTVYVCELDHTAKKFNSNINSNINSNSLYLAVSDVYHCPQSDIGMVLA